MSISLLRLDISGPLLITPQRFGDNRGFFSETYNARELAKFGIDEIFVQDNHSLSQKAGTVRGLHCQKPPTAQGKLVRVVKGSILDVAVDLRRESSTFGKHVTATLSASNWSQLWVPTGFAHGFCTLEDATEVIYKVTAPYAPEDELGVLWNDPALEIPWPESAGAEVSAKDAKLPLLRDLVSPF